MLAIYIAAKNSPNGNPQRGWIITNEIGEFVDFVDEGYRGSSALTYAGYSCPSTGRIEVERRVYHEFKRDAEARARDARRPIR